ncbi:c-type cytochrome [Aromatoleum aromaticum]|uniref:Di-heme cytochrome c (Class I), probably related to cytochrome c oxidase function n=1 Tax=Aromatoleum aromaticum (strain DSM 19018 / LMG 30748 / EbN1) TaxID=76114 RepID=Q5P1W8_AROAE|nr:c-type cytochrome [Aromatoleum aromaticum]NMG56104.1 c-type cytochrome [Aromatoleum aromaticum]CAI08696.1 Di-heme cytochrome c (class I), probably related to cytochrome c oxidase function [Aromatoleum aromaticum EbN1]
MKKILLTVVALATAAGLAGAAVVYGGFYDISATDQHLAPTYQLLDIAMRRSIKLRAASVTVPSLDTIGALEHGAPLYRDHCAQCHGAPGVAPEPFALGLTPAAANLAHTGRAWPPEEIYWVVRHGLKMTGMPAWEQRLTESELWAVTAFVKRLPELSPPDYRRLVADLPPHDHTQDHRGEPAPQRPDAERGRRIIQQYACATCHRIPGVVGPDAPVGPPLDGIGTRAFIAGALRNEPAHMVRWLRSPQEVTPDSAMPDLGVDERDAHDIAAYLATLK